MDIVSQILGFVPIGIVLGVYVMTLIARLLLLRRERTLPRFFILIPLILGLLSGVLHYFVAVDLETFRDVPLWRHVVSAIELSVGYAGAAVIVWEIRKRLFGNDEG